MNPYFMDREAEGKRRAYLREAEGYRLQMFAERERRSFLERAGMKVFAKILLTFRMLISTSSGALVRSESRLGINRRRQQRLRTHRLSHSGDP